MSWSSVSVVAVRGRAAVVAKARDNAGHVPGEVGIWAAGWPRSPSRDALLPYAAAVVPEAMRSNPIHCEDCAADVAWSTINAGEAIPGVVTPLTWSFFGDATDTAIKQTFCDLGVIGRAEVFAPERPERRMWDTFARGSEPATGCGSTAARAMSGSSNAAPRRRHPKLQANQGGTTP